MKKIKGRYEIKSQLGEGGMGVVFRAYDPPPMDRDVAIKTLPELADRLALELFYKECNVLKSISHPNIVEIFDMGEFEDAGKRKPFFVMPLLQGQTLDEILKHASHRLTVDRVVDIISQTCRGLQAAHEQGLIHRDIKPSNLFVIADDSVKIIDFGVVHTIDSLSRSGGFNKGTLLYMAPEQVMNKPVTVQSDIFSLGVVCYEALTRRQPFRGVTEQEIIDAIRRLIPAPASELNPAVSQLISRVVHKALAKQPLNRYDSAKDFGDILQRAAHNQPIDIFDPARIQPRIDRARRALETGDYQFAGEIVSELEAGGNIDPQIRELRADIDQVVRQRTIAQLLENAQTRYEEEEDPLALQKIHEILQIDPGNVKALGLKSKIEERRSERQVDQWMRLAEQHIQNHSYSRAREALQNVLALRPKESRALRLVKEIEADEQEYLLLRQEKADLYESAVNAWKNGDVSEALSHMRVVLDLDGRAPDMASPDVAASYQSFYNKIRSEHEALDGGYAEARRKLAEREFAGALEICTEFLRKYPGQPLFQALEFDVQEQQRQELSSFIADVTRRLDAESDLDAKASLLREAVARYPDEPQLRRSLKMAEDKRDLVKSILARAEVHEGRGQINEALSDFETLKTIYPLYSGLKYEIERLQKRREQQSRDTAKAEWIRKIDRHRETSNDARAIEILDKADAEFPNDPELIQLRKLSEQRFGESRKAEQLLHEGQRLCAEGRIDEGLDALRQAHGLDERNPAVRTALLEMMVDRARDAIATDWHLAERLIDEALDLDPQHAVAKSVRLQVSHRKRDDAIAACAIEARRLQADKDLDQAATVLKRVLALYPGDARLTVILDAIDKERGQSGRKKARLSDLEQLRELRRRADDAGDQGELKSIFEQTRQLANRYATEVGHSDIDSIADEIERIVRARGRDNSSTPRPGELMQGAPKGWRGNGQALRALATKGIPSKAAAAAAAALLIVIAVSVGAAMWYRASDKRGGPSAPPSAGAATIRVRTSPAGASISIDRQPRGTSDVQLSLDAGEHQVEATLAGYAPATRTMTISAGSPLELELTLQPLRDALRLATPDIESSDVWIDGTAIRLEGGSLTQNIATPGLHLLRISNPKASTPEARITFSTEAGSLPKVTAMEVPQYHVVAVSSLASVARVTSSLGSVGIVVDGKPRGVLTPDGLMIRDLVAGMHELTVGDGKDMRRMFFASGPGPALDAILYSDLDVGSVLVVTGESDVSVQLDGRDYPRKTVNGQLRLPNLPSRQHTIRVRKDGFAESEMQTVDVVKGQEAMVRFEFAAVLKLAKLEIAHALPGVQILVDENPVPLGAVSAAGTFSRDIPSGAHTLQLAMDGYETKRVTRDFAAGETVSLSGAEVELQRTSATIEVITDGPLEVTVMRDKQPVRRFTGGAKLAVAQGTYSILGRDAGGMSVSETVTVAPGESKTITLRIVVAGMEHFERAEWTRSGGAWFTHRGGGFVLYDNAHPAGRITFSMKPRRGRFRSGHVRWIVGFANARNYMLVDMDNKYLYRSEMIDGRKVDLPRVEHKISWDKPFIHIAIDLTDNNLVHQFGLEQATWTVFDNWDRAAPASAAQSKARSFVDGKFGFYLPGDEEIEVSNFAFYPSGAR